MSFISTPMGWILSQLSALFNNNFAASVLVFTLLVNIIMLPLTLKSQKSTAKQAKLKHKLDALKKKYGDDRQKYSQATQELYNKEGISMGGGCMPMIIRLIIMMGVYYAIVSPFTYVVNIDKTAIKAASEWTAYVRVVDSNKVSEADWKALGLETRAKDTDIIAAAEKHGDKDAAYYAKLSIVDAVSSTKDVKDDTAEKRVQEQIKENVVTREVEIAQYLNKDNAKFSPVVADVFKVNGGDIDKMDTIDFDLFGIDLRDTPDFSWNFKNFQTNWLIPIASFVASLATGIISQMIQKKANPEAPNMMVMMLIMPLFSLYIAFGFPCAVGFYWACSSLISGGIQVLTQKFYGPAVMNAKEQAKGIILRAEQEKERMARVDSSAE